MKIRSVFKFPNGMVAVCDESGQQVPELQGRWDDKCTAIAPHDDDDTELLGCTREDFPKNRASKSDP